jgi:hypothetical protein
LTLLTLTLEASLFSSTVKQVFLKAFDVFNSISTSFDEICRESFVLMASLRDKKRKGHGQ